MNDEVIGFSLYFFDLAPRVDFMLRQIDCNSQILFGNCAEVCQSQIIAAKFLEKASGQFITEPASVSLLFPIGILAVFFHSHSDRLNQMRSMDTKIS